MLRRIPVNQLVRLNIAGYDSARSYEAASPESNTTHDGRIRADRSTFLDPCLNWNPVSGATARCQIVSENCVRSKKNIVCHVYVFPNADSVFDRDVVADGYAAFDKCVVADIAVSADHDILLDVSKRPDASAFADLIGFD